MQHHQTIPMKSKPQIFKAFNKTVFFCTTTFFLMMLLPAFFSFWAWEEGTLRSGIWLWFARFFYVLRFPIHTLLWNLITSVNGPFIFFSTLILNCFFNGLIVERIVYLFKRKKIIAKQNPEAQTDLNA